MSQWRRQGGGQTRIPPVTPYYSRLMGTKLRGRRQLQVADRPLVQALGSTPGARIIYAATVWIAGNSATAVCRLSTVFDHRDHPLLGPLTGLERPSTETE